MKRSNKTLAETHPYLAQEWHPKLNDLTPHDVTLGCQYKAHWKCGDCGHIWQRRVKDRAIEGTGCPVCSVAKRGKITFDKTHPHLVAEWHPTKNGDKCPSNLLRGSNYDAHWICQHCGCEFQMQVESRTYGGVGCPNCCNNPAALVTPDNCLATTHPELAKMICPVRNVRLNAHNTRALQKTTLWFICECGVPFKARIDKLTKKAESQRRPPYCRSCMRKKMRPNTKFKWCYYLPKKCNSQILCRSSYELRYFLMLDANPKVRGYVVEYEKINYTDETGKKRKYITDVLVVFQDGTEQLVEIKPKYLLRHPNVLSKAREAVKYARSKGMVYKLVSENKLFASQKIATAFGKAVKKGHTYSWKDFRSLNPALAIA